MHVAISGLRHGHMASIAKHMSEHPGLKIVAVAEEHPEACQAYIDASGLKVTHPNLEALLKTAAFDILGVGDVYSARGAQVIRGLEAGKHILADKPLCTSLAEIRRIRALAAAKQRTVLVALTLRYCPSLQTARRLLREGTIGEIATGAVFGLHPLSYKSGRPDWYFERGCHGGTITDLMIHGVDALGWLTGHPVAEVLAARAWHVEPAEAPHFQDAAQVMLRLANGAGVTMDASYKAPKGHAGPWEFRFYGTKGALIAFSSGDVIVRRHGEPEQAVAAKAESPATLIDDLVHAIQPAKGYVPVLTTEECLVSTEKTIRAQEAADEKRAHVAV